MAKKTIRDIHLEGRKVLVRCDFNVPLDDGREITDDTRIVGAIPTIEYLIEKGAKVVLCSHLGRPGGKKDEKFSLDVVAKRLSQILDQNVTFVEDSIGDEVSDTVENLPNGGVILLENVRFYSEETENDLEFSNTLGSFADVFVNDAFGETILESDDRETALNFLRQNYMELKTCEICGPLSEAHHSGLRAWFGKGKKGGAGGGGWDRYNTKGERIGKCGDRKKGEGKPKCLSKARAASLRASGGKKAIAAAVRRKRRKDKNPERRGKAINVRNKKKK